MICPCEHDDEPCSIKGPETLGELTGIRFPVRTACCIQPLSLLPKFLSQTIIPIITDIVCF